MRVCVDERRMAVNDEECRTRRMTVRPGDDDDDDDDDDYSETPF